jgi:hypothetical protein
MNKTIVFSILLICIIAFSTYLYSYAKTRQSLDSNYYQCGSLCKDDSFGCSVWNENDKKCYPGSCKKGVCVENEEYQKINSWHISILSILILSIIIFMYFSITD